MTDDGRRLRRPWAALVLAPAGVLVIVGLVALAAACGGSGGQASPSPAASGPVVLTVKGEQDSRTFTMGQLQALPAYEGYAGIKSSTGTITPPSKYRGVPLAVARRPRRRDHPGATASPSWPRTATG